MSELKVHEVLARAFAAEGVDTLFALMGDGNMYWATALARQHGARIIHARHEHSAVAMADGWARKTGRVGVATTTCGPGFTQIMTALTVAVRRGTPLIVFVGDTPTTDGYHVQGIDQRPLAEATGARFIALRTMDRLLEDVREAFYVAAYERRPVVLSVPMDLQSRTFEWLPDYRPSAELMPRPQRMAPDPEMVAEAVQLIAGASKPIILAGEGAVRSGAGAVLEKLGERTGALLATTLRAKGFFDRSPWAIGISGAFAGDLAREYLAAADVVIAVGASLSAYTTEQGYMFPNAKVIQIDAQPRGLWQGLRVADLHIRADAQSAATALLAELEKRSARGEGFRSTATKEAIAADRPDARQQPIDPGTIDPRNALLELDKVIPADWDVVVGVGHFFNFVMTHMRGRVPERWHITHDFGAIGQGLPTAIGVAVARGDGKVILIEGDGSLLMHVQELEVLQRHGIKLLTCTLNDGAYSAEVHKLVPAGVDPGEAIFGRPDLAAIAKGFSLAGETVAAEGKLKDLFAAHERADRSTVWDLHVSGKVVSQQYRRVFWGET
jgi:thiamine pyrophosphate-dependent acetolactate synthase large subunit-like protein